MDEPRFDLVLHGSESRWRNFACLVEPAVFTSSFKNPNGAITVYVLESRLVSRGMVQGKSRFRNLKRVDGTTQEFVSGTFKVCKFQSCLLNTSSL